MNLSAARLPIGEGKANRNTISAMASKADLLSGICGTPVITVSSRNSTANAKAEDLDAQWIFGNTVMLQCGQD